MSRVGKKPILIPAGVEISINGQEVKAKGSKGELSFFVLPQILAELQDGQILFSVRPDTSNRKLTSKQKKNVQAVWGLSRNMVQNIIEGVVNGYVKKLEFEGLGYRVQVENGDLVLQVGFSHPLRVAQVKGIEFSVEKNVITVSGIDKELVGQTAAVIRRLRPPDPYKAKGIRYAGEIIKKKAGKKAAGAVGTTGK